MAGVRYVSRRRGPATALGATGGNRFLYGILFLMSILLYRNYFYRGASPSTAETHYGYLVALVAVGYFCAALITPPVTRRLSKAAFIALLLVVSAVAIGALGETFSQTGYLIMGFFLGVAGQGIAICATTVLQEQLPDGYRGRAFSLYDMMFNITFAAGALISVPFMPLNGKSQCACPGGRLRLRPGCGGVLADRPSLGRAGRRRRHRFPPMPPTSAVPERPVPAPAGPPPCGAQAGTGRPCRPAGPAGSPRTAMISLPSRSGRMLSSSSCAASSAIRASSAS